MVNKIELTGQKFGRWTVLHSSINKTSRQDKWLCLCECGKESIVFGFTLRNQTSKSCGCIQKEAVIINSTTHGQSNKNNITAEYYAWADIKQRCTNPKNKWYKAYGGRGITVCEAWLNSFEAFYNDMGPKPSPRHSIERNENNGNYEPGNCRWATIAEQNRNRRDNHWIEFNGKRMVFKDWALFLNMQTWDLYNALKKNTPFEEIYNKYKPMVA